MLKKSLLFVLCSTLLATVPMKPTDPMQPIDSGEFISSAESTDDTEESSEIDLTQIEALIVNNYRKIVTISGESFEEGQSIGNYLIKEITINTVVLQDINTNELKELRLGHVWDGHSYTEERAP